MSYNNQYNPLTKTQKSVISQLAREAFEHCYKHGLVESPGETKAKQFTNWRHAQQAEAVDESSLTKCQQRDFLPLRAHFNSILGRDDKAFNDHLKSQPANDRAAEDDTVESRAKKIHLIEEAIKDTKFHSNYVLAIAKNKFRKRKLTNLADLTTEQLHQLLVTTKERIRKAEKKTNSEAATKAENEAFLKALSMVDWNYQRAEGRSFYNGKAAYEKAQSLAVTPEQKAIFNQRKKEKQR